MNSAFAKMSVSSDCWHKYCHSISLISYDTFKDLQQKGGVSSVNFLADLSLVTIVLLCFISAFQNKSGVLSIKEHFFRFHIIFFF